jgi:hypothetical protein
MFVARAIQKIYFCNVSQFNFYFEDFKRHWDERRKEYFIDRHRDTFEVILNWLINGGPLVRKR